MSRKLPDASEMGKKGGQKRFETIGSEGMAEMAKKANQAMREKGDEFLKERARKSVESRKRNKKLRKEKESSVGKLISSLTGK